MRKTIALLLVCLAACAQNLTRDLLYKALLAGDILNPDRELVHMSETCTLQLSGKLFSVIDIQELVKGASTPRGVNRVVVLDSALKPVRTIAYATQRPLFCLDNKLFVYGDVTLDNSGAEGNVLTFANGARDVTLSHVEANDYPVPSTRNRKGSPQ